MSIHAGDGTPRSESESHRGNSKITFAGEGHDSRNDPCTVSRHGTITTYKRHHCRCTACREAWAHYNKAYQCEFYRGRRRQVTPDTTRSILGALWADGWSFPELGRRLDVQAKTVAAIVHGDRTRVTVTIHRSVIALADDILGWPGPSNKARSTAKAHGWTPNLSMMEKPATSGRRRSSSTVSPTTFSVDPVVVERLIAGRPPLHVTPAERAEAVLLLERSGKTRSEISVQLHMSGTRIAQILAAAVRSATDTHATDEHQEASA